MPEVKDTLTPSFADLLSSHRGAADLTQEELAARAGLSVSAISLLERGARTAPRACTVARLAAALELDDSARQEFAAAARRKPVPPALPVSLLSNRLPQSLALHVEGRKRVGAA
jgi:transcriptional regulator with XRE-family HTH domain